MNKKEAFYKKICSGIRSISQRSSLSDDGMYPLAVKKAVQNDAEFRWFRRNPIYRQIVEAPCEEEGKVFIKILNQIWPEWKDYLDIMRENDKVGNPYTYHYPGIGKIAPYTLQKMCELAQIRRTFPEMFVGASKLRIAEIGVGYGGLFRLMYHMGIIEEYTMFDLPDVLRLTEKYLSCYPEIDDIVIYKDKPDDVREYDFVISNHAYNELCPELQDLYLKKVLKNSKHGFLIYNDFYYEKGNKRNRDRYTAVELIHRIPNAKIIPKLPHTKNGSIVVF